MSWRFNDNTFDYTPVETYFNDFFYPNLLQDVLNGKSPKPKAGQELEKIDRRQPKVEIVSSTLSLAGEIAHIIVVFEFPPRAFWRILVSAESL